VPGRPGAKFFQLFSQKVLTNKQLYGIIYTEKESEVSNMGSILVRYQVVIGKLNGCHTTEDFDKYEDARDRYNAWRRANYEAHIVVVSINLEELTATYNPLV
jgi:hypothetical protein